MTLEDYQNEWETDANFNWLDLLPEIAKVPVLHAKYLRWHSNERSRARKMLEAKKVLYTKLEGYYNGSIDGRDIGREPFQQIVKTADLLKKKIEADEDMIKRNIAIIDQEEKVDFLHGVITELNKMGFLFKSYIDYQKFTNGVG